MNGTNLFKIALRALNNNKLRAFLTMLGIIIGVASVVIMVSVVQGQNKKNMEYFEKMGNNKITVSAYSYYDSNNETSQKLYDYCLSLSNLVDGITPDVELNDKATVQYGAKTLWSTTTTATTTGRRPCTLNLARTNTGCATTIA